jgi:hypothetical protein
MRSSALILIWVLGLQAIPQHSLIMIISGKGEQTLIYFRSFMVPRGLDCLKLHRLAEIGTKYAHCYANRPICLSKNRKSYEPAGVYDLFAIDNVPECCKDLIKPEPFSKC